MNHTWEIIVNKVNKESPLGNKKILIQEIFISLYPKLKIDWDKIWGEFDCIVANEITWEEQIEILKIVATKYIK